MNVGIVGLGLMGSALADALLSKNYNVGVWNRSIEKCKRFAEAGAEVADSVAVAATKYDVLIVCLSDYKTSMEVLDRDPVADQMAGKVLILLSTMSGEESLTTAQWADERNIAYLD